MNPNTEKTAKPAKMLVKLFRKHSATQSLQDIQSRNAANLETAKTLTRSRASHL